MKKFYSKKNNQKTKRGFTIIEVMLVLAITGLMLVGVLGGTYRNIEQQRYTDSYRSFAEYLRQNYNEALSPESWNTSESTGEMTAGQSQQAIYGKILVFGLNGNSEHVYSATVVGKATLSSGTSSSDFIEDLLAGTENNTKMIRCDTVADYKVRYEARLVAPMLDTASGSSSAFKGTLLIARSPSSGTIHTRFYRDKTYDISSQSSCNNTDASAQLRTDLEKNPPEFLSENVDICVKSEGSSIVRGVRIKENARNSSGVNMLTEEESLKLKDNGAAGGVWQCR